MITHVAIYKVVQIWPGLIVCKQVTVCPGHIWTTLYFGTVVRQSCKLAESRSEFLSRLMIVWPYRKAWRPQNIQILLISLSYLSLISLPTPKCGKFSNWNTFMEFSSPLCVFHNTHAWRFYRTRIHKAFKLRIYLIWLPNINDRNPVLCSNRNIYLCHV
jgi:hypothetical protein